MLGLHFSYIHKGKQKNPLLTCTAKSKQSDLQTVPIMKAENDADHGQRDTIDWGYTQEAKHFICSTCWAPVLNQKWNCRMQLCDPTDTSFLDGKVTPITRATQSFQSEYLVKMQVKFKWTRKYEKIYFLKELSFPLMSG